MRDEISDEEECVQRAIDGDPAALAELFEQSRARLKRMVQLRIDPKVQGRADASDVVQEAYVEAARRMPEYVKESKMPFYVWLRLVTGERLAKLHRKHLGTAKRNARLNVSISQGHVPHASSLNLAAHLVGRVTSPSRQMMHEELRSKIQTVLEAMPEQDREVIALRHFEEMTIQESAVALDLSYTAASSRYVRAIKKIKEAFEQYSDLLNLDDRR